MDLTAAEESASPLLQLQPWLHDQLEPLPLLNDGLFADGHVEGLPPMLDLDAGTSSAPSSPSLTSVSSFWDRNTLSDGTNRVWTREHDGSLPRLTDHAYLDARAGKESMSTCVSEAIQEKLLLKDLSQLEGKLLAPVHSTDDIVHSLLQTATAGASSEHFQWDQTTATFVWARSSQHEADMRVSRRSMQRRRDTAESVDVPQPWVGTERLCGWSSVSSNSVADPFLSMAALLRRLDDRLSSIRKISNPRCKETPAFAFALDTVLAWIKQELRDWSSQRDSDTQHIDAAILNAQAGLEAPFAILKTLGNLLSCGQPRQPPFRPLSWLDTTHACLSHLHAHLAAAMSSAASPLSSAVVAYLLEQTSCSWRVQVAKWMGYPGFQSDRTGELDDMTISAKKSDGHSKVGVPWSGAEIDWSFDERGEEDIGYTLRPSAVPSFLTFRSARTFLEAGRALRLLKKAAPKDHPLVCLWSLGPDRIKDSNSQLPTWTWAQSGKEDHGASIDETVLDLKRSIARWRRQRHKQQHALKQSGSGRGSSLGIRPLSQQSLLPPSQSAEPSTSTLVPLPPLPPIDLMTELSVEERFKQMTERFESLPFGSWEEQEHLRLAVPDEQISQNELQMSEGDTLLVYLSRTVGTTTAPHQSETILGAQQSAIERCSFDDTTQQSVVAPFQTWARLINTSLISVFFQDLGLGTYLETCKQFLLLGSEHFERQVTSSLFELEKRSVLLQALGQRQTVVAMNPTLTADGVWPPNDHLLSSALNTAVVETVSGMRLAHAERSMTNNLRGTALEDPVALAYRDLEARLSFATIEPTSATKTKGGRFTWQDPSSIDALDWLTLSFHPPPLISPLLTQLAQSRYQRLWNVLLRIKRCKAAMRTAWQSTFKSASALFTFDFTLNTLMQQMRWSIGHFLDIFGSFVQEVGIEYEWRRFKGRLERVKSEVSDELLDSVVPRKRKTSGASRASSGRPIDVGSQEAEAHEDDDDDDDEADMANLDEEQRQARSTSNQLELKDVFSLARYHERVLDRMLETCFLKTRQRGMAKIINSLLQCCLDFAQLCTDYHAPAVDQQSAPSYAEFRQLQRHFDSRMETFVQALVMLKDRQRPHGGTLEEAGQEEEDDRTMPKRRRDIEGERNRMMMDELEDLRRLDTDATGKGAQQSDTEASSSVEILLVRLNAAGFYGDADY